MDVRSMPRVLQIGLLAIAAITVAGFVSWLAFGRAEAHEGGETSGALEGREWQLTSLNGTAPLADSPITLLFEEGRVAGSSGVNRYFGGYEVEGEKMTIGQVGGTLMAGPEPLMQQEAAYLAALQATTSYRVSGDTLTLTTPDGALEFSAAHEPG